MAESFQVKTTQRSKRRLVFSASIGLVLLVATAWWARERAIYRFLHQDRIWSSKVRRQINFEETRTWALRVIEEADPYGPVTEHQTFLTNAPRDLLNNYKHRPHVTHGFDCIHLSYGGGMYGWGLTIGATNLPAGSARGRHAEQWSPGIYFWDD